jgi:hypothetical protein
MPVLLLLLALLHGAPLVAQGPLSLEVRAGAVLPTGSFRSRTLAEPGPGFGVQFVYRRTANRAFYVGFDQERFGCDPAACRGEELVSTGWALGTRLQLAPEAAWAPWLRLGMVFDRVEGELFHGDGAPPSDDVSDLGLGGEAGVGAVVRVGGRFSLSPGARYRILNTRFDDAGLVRLRSFGLELGMVMGF